MSATIAGGPAVASTGGPLVAAASLLAAAALLGSGTAHVSVTVSGRKISVQIPQSIGEPVRWSV
jgi:hypothetical protein